MATMSHSRRLIAAFTLLAAVSSLTWAEETVYGAAAYTLDLPEGWRLIDGPEGTSQAFSDPSQTAILQVFALERGLHGDVMELFATIRDSLGARGEGAPFSFSGLPAVLTDLTFDTGVAPARGYALFVSGSDRDYALISFTALATYETHHDSLLSALDSFAPHAHARSEPGPISQFYHPYPAERSEKLSVEIAGAGVGLAFDGEEGEATQVLIEREARLLAAERARFLPAWRRYFRVIYRDNFARLADFARDVEAPLRGRPPREKAEALLAWIQGFHYYRTGTLSDLTSPLACLTGAAGDCDSRALLYVILLHHMGIDATLLVSTRYQHSAVAVDVPGPGAQIAIDGRGFVFAEVTDRVDLGLVAREMADPSGWIPVPLGLPAAVPAR